MNSNTHRITWIVTVPVALLLAACGSGSSGADQVTTASSSAARSAPAAGETTQSEKPAVTKRSYRVTFRETDKQCFGSGEYSAGCSIEGKLRLALVEPQAEGVAADVTVRVKGDDGGPVTETISVDEDGNYSAPELFLSTPRSATKIKVAVTDVEVTS